MGAPSCTCARAMTVNTLSVWDLMYWLDFGEDDSVAIQFADVGVVVGHQCASSEKMGVRRGRWLDGKRMCASFDG